MRRVAEETRLYEGMFLVRNKAAKEDLDGVMKEITSYIEEIGGTIINSDKWDERKLAYDIAGERRGTYIIYHFEAKPEGIVRLERLCQISETVLRTMVVRDTDGTDLPPQGGGISGGPAEGVPGVGDGGDDRSDRDENAG